MDGLAFGEVGGDSAPGEKRMIARSHGLVTRVAGHFTAPVRS